MSFKFIKKICKENSGFTLVEIMVAAGLLGGLSLAVMELTSNSAKSAKKLQQDFEISNVMSNVVNVLRDEKSCSRNFNADYSGGGLGTYSAGNVSSTDGSPIGDQILKWDAQLSSSYIIVNQGDTYGSLQSTKIELTSINFRDNNAVTASVAGTVPALFTRPVILQFLFTRLGAPGSFFGSATIVRDVALQVVQNASGRIVKCSSSESSFMEEVCLSLGGHYNLASNRCENLRIDQATDGETPDNNHADSIQANGNMRVAAAGNLYVGYDNAGALTNSYVTSAAYSGTTGGNADIFGDLNVGLNFKTLGTSELVGSTTIGSTAYSVGPGDAPLLTVNGNTNLLGGLTVGQATTLQDTLTVTGRTILSGSPDNVIINGTMGSQALYVTGEIWTVWDPPGTDPPISARVATEPWVNLLLSGEIGTTDRADILQWLLRQVLDDTPEAADYDNIKDNIKEVVFSQLQTSCGAGSYVKSISALGVVACSATWNASCGAGQYLNSVNSAGVANCAIVCDDTSNIYSHNGSGGGGYDVAACIPPTYGGCVNNPPYYCM